MKSLWRSRENGNPERISIERSVAEGTHWDVIVVGAGMAGILTAYYLKEQGKRVLVLEADRIASGQTEKTTAKITSQHDIKYSKLIKTVGRKKAKLYAEANEEAIREYERLVALNRIECEFKRVPAYLYTLKNQTALEEEARVATSLGIDAFFTKETELPFWVAGAVCFQNQAQFSPLKFIHSISSEVEIMEHTKVIAIKGKKVITKDMEITAEKIVITTHYPIKNVPGFYFIRQHQERSYVLALYGCNKINGMYYGVDQDGLSFRQAGDVLLLGGGSHRTGENKKGGAYDFLVQASRKYFPDCREETRWSAQDCMPHDGIPFIGKYSMFTPNLYVATGFQKWGMTSSMIAAMVLRDELCEKENPYAKLFSPQRIQLRAALGNLLCDVGKSAEGLYKGAFHRPKDKAESLLPGHGGIVTIEGKRYACYKDEEGRLHKISASCSHMGCELSWNPDEKSWDCPCHGSRFDMDGMLLDNPAKNDEWIR
ncbi:MAG: FAD-dependent oxidoreductase [Lachnospiraceae bacterium]|nr:FAD-dependent oxidoreductase [Lachnospiraceae bacterium]